VERYYINSKASVPSTVKRLLISTVMAWSGPEVCKRNRLSSANIVRSSSGLDSCAEECYLFQTLGFLGIVFVVAARMRRRARASFYPCQASSFLSYMRGCPAPLARESVRRSYTSFSVSGIDKLRFKRSLLLIKFFRSVQTFRK